MYSCPFSLSKEGNLTDPPQSSAACGGKEVLLFHESSTEGPAKGVVGSYGLASLGPRPDTKRWTLEKNLPSSVQTLGSPPDHQNRKPDTFDMWVIIFGRGGGFKNKGFATCGSQASPYTLHEFVSPSFLRTFPIPLSTILLPSETSLMRKVSGILLAKDQVEIASWDPNHHTAIPGHWRSSKSLPVMPLIRKSGHVTMGHKT